MIQVVKWKDGVGEVVSVGIPEELPVEIFLNDIHIVTISSTPEKLNELAVGFLYSEGFIENRGDIKNLFNDPKKGVVRVETGEKKKVLSRLLDQKSIVLTSGCGKGTSFSNPLDHKGLEKLDSSVRVSPQVVSGLMKKMFDKGVLYRKGGGIHSAAVCDEKGILVFSEDIARHNTVDKVLGECLLKGIDTRDKMLFSSGRISSEMIQKAIIGRIPIVASCSAPTNLTMEIGEKFGVTVIGYVRAKGMRVYCHPWRIDGGLDG